MKSRIAQLSSVLVLVSASAACADQEASRATAAPVTLPPAPSVVASAKPPVEGSVLSFYEVDDNIDPFRSMYDDRSTVPEGVEPSMENAGDGIRAYLDIRYAPNARQRTEQVTKDLSKLLPPGRTLGWELVSALTDDGTWQPSRFRTYVLGARILTEKQVKHATAEASDFGSQLKIELDDPGAKAFEEGTRRLVERRMAVLAFGEIISVPHVKSGIGGGSIVLAMDRSGGMAAAEKLAAALNR